MWDRVKKWWRGKLRHTSAIQEHINESDQYDWERPLLAAVLLWTGKNWSNILSVAALLVSIKACSISGDVEKDSKRDDERSDRQCTPENVGRWVNFLDQDLFTET